MRKTLSIILTTILSIYLFTGCAEMTNYNAKDKEKIKIGICISDINDKFLSYMIKEMRLYSESLNNIDIEYVDSKKDSNIQLSQVEDFISEGVDVLVINPVDRDSTNEIGLKAKEARVPIISVNNEFDNPDDPVCFIDSDRKQSGILEMEYLCKKVNYKGNVAIIIGFMGNEAQRLRTEAFHEVIEKYPNMNIVAEQSAGWNRAKGKALMESWLESGKDINVVACENDEMAIGAIMAIEEAGKLGEIAVGGIDATPEALDCLKNGKLAVTVYPNLNNQSQAVLDMAVKAAKGEKVEKTISFQNELVTREDADKYIEKWTN